MFEIGNFIKLYMVNDSPKAARGKVHVQLFDPIRNVCQDTFEVPFEVLADESRVLCDLNRFGQFKNNNILFAYAVDESGNRIAEAIDYCEMERRMRFPKDARIHMEMVDGGIRITQTRMPASIELLGFCDDGDAFGWLIDDNTLPEPRRCQDGYPAAGKNSIAIAAKANYADHTTTKRRSCLSIFECWVYDRSAIEMMYICNDNQLLRVLIQRMTDCRYMKAVRKKAPATLGAAGLFPGRETRFEHATAVFSETLLYL